MNNVETLVQVVWTDIDLEEDRKDFRTGVKFVDILPGDLEELRNFLKSLAGEVTQGMR